jgi:pyocin large subunit-like protein
VGPDLVDIPKQSGKIAASAGIVGLLRKAGRVLGLVRRGAAAPNTTLKLPTSQTGGRLDTLDDHFLRHGADFGARSADDYASQASQFLQRSQQVRLPNKIDANGVIRVYDPASNTFGAYNPNGTTATFFTPKTGADYWAKQPGVSPWSP